MYSLLIANEVNKFGEIFPIHRRRKYKDHFDFTSKSHLGRMILCQGYSTFFFQTYFRITCILM
jgi:hypothetical protein